MFAKYMIDMKKLALIALVLFSFNVDAQYITTIAKNAAQPQEGGVLYYLPRNVIAVEFTIEETRSVMGPYSEYASSVLGLTEYIRENKTEAKIIGVNIKTGVEADPNAVFLIAQDEKSKEAMPNVILNKDGLILAMGYDNIPADYNVECNELVIDNHEIVKPEKISFIDIVEVEEDEEEDESEEEGSSTTKKTLTKEDRAIIAAEQIRKYRNAYYELVSGFLEVAYGDATKYMAKSLKDIENEYISLFKGKCSKCIYKKVVYITPEKSQANGNVTIAKFSTTDGILDANAKGGDAVKIQFDSKASLANLNPVDDGILNAGQSNKLISRVPINTNVKLLCNNEILADKRLNINQFGEFMIVPAKSNKVLFNPNSGQVVSITK